MPGMQVTVLEDVHEWHSDTNGQAEAALLRCVYTGGVQHTFAEKEEFAGF